MNPDSSPSSVHTPGESWSERRYTAVALVVILISGLFRAVFIRAYDVSTDEAWFWLWSTRLDWSYMDHPPLVAYVVWAIRQVFGEAAWAWRATAIILSCMAAWLLFCTSRLLFSARAGMWTAAAFACSPLYALLGLVLLPESLLVFWTAVAVYLAAKLLRTGELRLFYPLGLVFGLGMLSNLTALLIPTGVVLFGAASPRHRYWFKRGAPYAGTLLGLLTMAPMLYWNWQHDWAAGRYLFDRIELNELNAQPGLPLVWQTLAVQALCHSPLLWLCLCAGVLAGIRRVWRERDERIGLLLCLIVPLFGLFIVVSTSGDTQPHWPASAYLAAYVLLPGVVFRPGFQWSRLKRALAAATLGLAACMSALLPVSMNYPVLSKTSRYQEKLGILPADAPEPMAQSEGWRQEIRRGLIEIGRRIEGEQGRRPVLLTHLNGIAALLDYYVGDFYEVISVHAQAYQYNIWFDDDDLVDRPVLFVDAELFSRAVGKSGQPEDYYVFDDCRKEDHVIEVVRYDITINRVHAWLCTGYRGVAE